jgi:hypothetical protein
MGVSVFPPLACFGASRSHGSARGPGSLPSGGPSWRHLLPGGSGGERQGVGCARGAAAGTGEAALPDAVGNLLRRSGAEWCERCMHRGPADAAASGWCWWKAEIFSLHRGGRRPVRMPAMRLTPGPILKCTQGASCARASLGMSTSSSGDGTPVSADAPRWKATAGRWRRSLSGAGGTPFGNRTPADFAAGRGGLRGAHPQNPSAHLPPGAKR